MKRVLAFIGSFSIFLLTGCNQLPEPGSLIQVPKQTLAGSSAASDTKLHLLARKFLPKGTALLAPNSPVSEEIALTADLDNDGNEEVLAFYQSKTNASQVGMFVLKKNHGKWEKVFTKKGLGYEVSWASAADLTGDGIKELLVGWKIGSSAGNALELFTWKKSGLEEIAKVNYHDLSVLEWEEDPKARLAVWKKGANETYNVDLLAWDGQELATDKDHYPSYFPEVVKYYEKRIESVRDASYYWYYLADALLKADEPERALTAVETGMAYKMVVPSYPQFVELKGKVEQALEKKKESDLSFEFRDAELTIDVPKEISPHIAFEEGPGTQNNYVISVFSAPNEESKLLLFTVEIYSKDLYVPEKKSGLKEMAETDEYIYFVKKTKETEVVPSIHEKSVALADQIISNVRPGLVHPVFKSAEDENVLEFVKEAASRYAYVTSGGKMPDGLVETFLHKETEYRYMGSDLDSEKKLIAYLTDFYTLGSIRSYMDRMNLIERNGKLAQPNADGGSLLNYNRANVVRKKESLMEKEYDLKVPLGNSLSFEYVHVTFYKTKNGWKISSEMGTF